MSIMQAKIATFQYEVAEAIVQELELKGKFHYRGSWNRNTYEPLISLIRRKILISN